MKQLATRDIGTRPFFWPMHLQPVFQRMGLFQSETYPVAERLGAHGFYLPSGLGLLDEQITEVSGALREVSGQIAIAN